MGVGVDEGWRPWHDFYRPVKRSWLDVPDLKERRHSPAFQGDLYKQAHVR